MCGPGLPSLACPRCGEVFETANRPKREPSDHGTPLEWFLHHAERDHDLGDLEALDLLLLILQPIRTGLAVSS